jgi:Protein of unknown function (DUF2927)
VKSACCILFLAAVAGAALAEGSDGVPADQRLSDADFFRLATCGAAPGGDCQGPTVRWPGPEVTVALLPGKTAAERATARRIDRALNRVISRINGVGSGLALRRITGPAADIRIRSTELPEGTVLGDVPGLSAAGTMGVGYVSLWWSDAHKITEASILFSTDITNADLPSVVLEELFQSLGPRYDIEGPAYEGRSILSQTSNATTTITGQDAMLLRRLYPPQP